jgi:hypothetical protein
MEGRNQIYDTYKSGSDAHTVGNLGRFLVKLYVFYRWLNLAAIILAMGRQVGLFAFFEFVYYSLELCIEGTL